MSKIITSIGLGLVGYNATRVQPHLASSLNRFSIRQYNYLTTNPKQATAQKLYVNQTQSRRVQSCRSFGNSPTTSPQSTIVDVLEREIQDESVELSRQLSSDQFPGFSVETDNSDVKLSKKVENATVNVRFTVSSSLNEWSISEPAQDESAPMESKLLSLPEFQVQIVKGGSTLELSCYFEEDAGEVGEDGQPMSEEPYFCIDELVLYEGEPKDTEFAVSAEFFEEDLQAALLQYLADHGIDDTFTKNLVAFSTSYEKKQYIGLMKRLKNFVSK